MNEKKRNEKGKKQIPDPSSAHPQVRLEEYRRIERQRKINKYVN